MTNIHVCHFSSVAQSCLTLCNSMDCSTLTSPSFTMSQSVLKIMSIKSVMPSNHFILCRPLHLPSDFLSIRVFFNESSFHIRWPKDWSFSFSISPSSEYSGLISFRTDWFDLFAVQGTLKSFLQYHSSKASILWFLTLFIVQLSLPHMTTGKTIALTSYQGRPDSSVCKEPSCNAGDLGLIPGSGISTGEGIGYSL